MITRQFSLVKCLYHNCKSEVKHKVYVETERNRTDEDRFIWLCDEHFRIIDGVYDLEKVSKGRGKDTLKVYRRTGWEEEENLKDNRDKPNSAFEP